LKKEVKVNFDLESYKEYQALKTNIEHNKKTKKPPTYVQLLKSIDETIEKLKENPFIGNQIPRKYIPKNTIQRYGTDKLFRCELVGYWRLIYTVIGSEIEIIAFILEYMDHDTYNKRFNYKKK
jgi:Txe/YoeB family toxin of Txe-Axe toxin-antitoxin module